MTDLSTEQSAALVAALENGGRFNLKKDRTSPLEVLRFAEVIVYHEPSGELRETGVYLTEAGRIVAGLCKERGSLRVALADCVEAMTKKATHDAHASAIYIERRTDMDARQCNAANAALKALNPVTVPAAPEEKE